MNSFGKIFFVDICSTAGGMSPEGIQWHGCLLSPDACQADPTWRRHIWRQLWWQKVCITFMPCDSHVQPNFRL